MNRVIVENQCLTELKQVSSDKLEEVLSFLRDLNQNAHFAQNNQNISSDSVDALKILLDMSQPTDFNEISSVETTDLIKKTAGILADQQIDPLKWQHEMRQEWDDRI